MTEKELKQYYEIYTDCWKLFREYSEPDGTDEFWQRLVDEVDMLHKKHGKSKFSQKMLFETMDEIEGVYKKKI